MADIFDAIEQQPAAGPDIFDAISTPTAADLPPEMAGADVPPSFWSFSDRAPDDAHPNLPANTPDFFSQPGIKKLAGAFEGPDLTGIIPRGFFEHSMLGKGRFSEFMEGGARGAEKFASGLLSPGNIALWMTSAGIGPAAQKVVAAYFALDMGRQLPEESRALTQAIASGDARAIGEEAVKLGGTAAFTVLAGRHALAKAPSETLPAGYKAEPTRDTPATPPPATAKPAEPFGAGRQPGAAADAFKVEFTPEDAPNIPKETVPVEPATATALQSAPVVEFPIEKLKLSKDVPNFKAGADAESGTVAGQELQGSYERRGTAPIIAWERANGEMEVITGRHRLDLARRTGEKTIPTQIVREADGFTKDMALTFDAEANIRDAQGEVSDYATYFKGSNISEAEARARGLLSRAKGKAGWSLAKAASDDLYALYRAGKVSEGQAVAIANAAPGDAAAQQVGSKFALQGKPADFLTNLIKASKAEAGQRGQTLDLFGNDDAAMQTMAEQAERAAGFQRDIAEQIRAVQGAAKRPEAARKLGVDVKDPEAVTRKVAELKTELTRWENWPMQPDLVAKVRGEGPTANTAPETAPSPASKPPEKTEAKPSSDLFSGQSDAPFNLAAEKAKTVPPTETKTGFGGDTLTQNDLFAIAEVVREVDPFKNANAAEKLYGSPAQAAAKIKAQLRLVDSDPAQKRAFSKEQRARLAEVLNVLGERSAASSKPGKSAAYAEPSGPGGELGGGVKPLPADNPRFSVFDGMPVELPEAVQLVKALTGIYPKVKQRLRALGGRAIGVFIHNAKTGRIELRADIFKLAVDEMKLRAEAEAYAKTVAEAGDDAAKIAADRFEYLREQAVEEAKRKNPALALKVIWHEIGHLVDWLPDGIIRGRGNLFGRIAAFKSYLRHTLPIDPSQPAGQPLTPKERLRLHKTARRQMEQEVGPLREVVSKILVEEPELRVVGITPADVKNLFGMDARETMPELYQWFVAQTDAVKSEIVRKAMRGLLDERLAALGKSEVVGTRLIEKTVRSRIGREPTPQEVAARFQKLLRDEMLKRNLAQLKEVRAELEPLIAWWRGTEAMEAYFKPSSEMYAEAFSVLMNNPAAVNQRAPQYAALMWNYMDRRPGFKKLYDAIQRDIKSGAVMPQRVKNLLQSWADDDARSLRTAIARANRSGRDFLDNVQYHFDRRFGPVYRLVTGTDNEGAVREAIGSFLYRATEHERYLGGVHTRVGKWLVDNGLDWQHDLGEFLFHQRVANERLDIANPLGWSSKTSLERLAEMKAAMRPEQWSALETAAKEFRALYEQHVVTPLRESGMFTPELMDHIEHNVFYSTFAAIKNLPDTGIERLLNLSYGAGVTPHIYRQVGNLGEIKNPATATVLKALSLISAIARNNMKRAITEALPPEDIASADRVWKGKGWEFVPRETTLVGTVVFLRGGKPEAYYVRRSVADAANSGNPTENMVLGALQNFTGLQKGIFTQLNYAFWPFNFVKDTAGWWGQMPGVKTPVEWMKRLPTALAAARASVTHAKPNAYAEDALRRRMLISKGDPRGVYAAAENEFELKLASFGMTPHEWNKHSDKVTGLVKFWNWYREMGQTVERVNKISGMIYLDEKFPTMPEWKKRQIVRERAGSPNFLERGASSVSVDLVWLFFNPWKEGVRSVVNSARENPFSFAAKGTALLVTPSVLQAAAVNGWLGDNRKRQYQSVPDYDLTNYLVVPLGWADEKQKKLAYLRLPLWEPARMVHGSLFQSLTGRGQGILSFNAGQLPGLNPIWKVGYYAAAYAKGQNPYDFTRGTEIMDETTFKAGGADAAGELAKQVWNELGGSVIHRFKNLNLEAPAETLPEKFLAAPIVSNALGRWVKVSNRGLNDLDRKTIEPIERERAVMRKGVQLVMGKVLNGEALTDAERLLLREPYAMNYFGSTMPKLMAKRSDPTVRRLLNAPNLESRAAIIRQLGGEP